MVRISDIAALCTIILVSLPAHAQVTLKECIRLAEENYPQIREKVLIETDLKSDRSNAALGWVPALNISGKASWQSDVVEMPFEIPGYDFNLPHDQYSLVAEITQTLWDGGLSGNLRKKAEADAGVRRSELDVSLYQIRSRVENAYLGILLTDSQIEQSRLLTENLRRKRDETAAMAESGIAGMSDIDLVDVNILNRMQETEQMQKTREAFAGVLSMLTGTDMTDMTLEMPAMTEISGADSIMRPEMAMYDAQLYLNEIQRKSLDTKISPRLNAYVQGGTGQPGLNMLKAGFSAYCTAGIRLQWDIGALYTRGNDIRKIASQRKEIEIARETFIFNTRTDLIQKAKEIEKVRAVLEKDDDIISLRESIRRSGEEQYRNGVITMTDLMEHFDNEYNARIAKSIHEI